MASLSFANLSTRIMNAIRIPVANTTESAKVDAIINMVYREICGKYDFYWLTKRTTLVTSDDITTGTVSVTKGNVAITFSSAPSVSIAGRTFYVSGNAVEDALFRIATHTAGLADATLASAYTGATDTVATYNVWQDEYNLPDAGKVLHVKRFGSPYPLQIIGAQEMYNLKIHDRGEGIPQLAAIDDYSTTGDPTTSRRFIVHPFPDDTFSLEIHYRQALNTELSGTTRPLIPDDWLHVLEWGSLAECYPIFLKDVSRGSMYRQKYIDGLNLMVARHREWEDAPQIAIRDDYRSFYRRGKRVTAANADLGSYFDRWPYSP